jgi:hypothetical protein
VERAALGLCRRMGNPGRGIAVTRPRPWVSAFEPAVGANSSGEEVAVDLVERQGGECPCAPLPSAIAPLGRMALATALDSRRRQLTQHSVHVCLGDRGQPVGFVSLDLAVRAETVELVRPLGRPRPPRKPHTVPRAPVGDAVLLREDLDALTLVNVRLLAIRERDAARDHRPREAPGLRCGNRRLEEGPHMPAIAAARLLQERRQAMFGEATLDGERRGLRVFECKGMSLSIQIDADPRRRTVRGGSVGPHPKPPHHLLRPTPRRVRRANRGSAVPEDMPREQVGERPVRVHGAGFSPASEDCHPIGPSEEPLFEEAKPRGHVSFRWISHATTP